MWFESSHARQGTVCSRHFLFIVIVNHAGVVDANTISCFKSRLDTLADQPSRFV